MEGFPYKPETNSRRNQTLFYIVLKNMKKGEVNKINQITDKKGETLTGSTELIERWSEHFIEVLKANE